MEKVMVFLPRQKMSALHRVLKRSGAVVIKYHVVAMMKCQLKGACFVTWESGSVLLCILRGTLFERILGEVSFQNRPPNAS